MKLNRDHLSGAIGIAAGLALCLGGVWWNNYTFAHSNNKRINVNIGAGLLLLLGAVIALVGLAYFLLAFRRTTHTEETQDRA